MELYGREFVIDHVLASLRYENRDTLFRSYIADAVMLMGENVAGLTHGKYIPTRWVDMIDPNKASRDDRSGDEIAANIISRMGLKLQGENDGGHCLRT